MLEIIHLERVSLSFIKTNHRLPISKKFIDQISIISQSKAVVYDPLLPNHEHGNRVKMYESMENRVD